MAPDGAPGIRLGPHQHGKAEVRLVRVTRDDPRHELEDLSITSQLRGDFAAAHTRGDNAGVIATDTQKNVVYGLAKEVGVGSPEAFLLALADHFTGSAEHVTGGRWSAEAYSWARIPVAGAEHDHAFVRSGAETRTAVVVRDGPSTTVVSGLTDLVVLKTTGSEFSGFPRDRFTTLAETSDRILATSVTARWLHEDPTGVDFTTTYEQVRTLLLETFASVHSKALQQTLYAMGTAVLQAVPGIREIRFSMPNKHHFLVDLAPFGLDNPGEVFHAADRPYGLIEASVLREGAPDATAAWASVTDFC